MLCRYLLDAAFRGFHRLIREENPLYYCLVVPLQMVSPILTASPQRCGQREPPIVKRLYNPDGLAETIHSASLSSVHSLMSSQIQPTAIYSLSPLERCPLEVLERVVLSAAEEQLPGPPSSLLPLLLTSKAVNFALSPERNNSLYASLFALKFDTAAASRRLTIRWLTSRCLSSELRSRFGALNRIRRGAIDDPMLPYDLWTVFLILLEHDHKNALQLTEWARVHTFVLRVAERWLAGGYGPEFTENVGGLVCRIFWELVREGQPRTVSRA